MKKPNYPLRILVFTCVAHALTHAYMVLFAPILVPMGRSFDLDVAGITFFWTLGNAFFGLGALPSGWLGDRYGEKVMLTVFFLGCAAGATLVGLAPNAWVLGIGVVVLGTATSIFHPVGNALISKGVASRGRAMGINGIAGSVGTALGPVIAGVAALHDWRWAFLGLAAPSVLLGFWLGSTDLGPAARPAAGDHLPDRAADPRPPAPERLPASRVTLFFFLLTAMTCGGFIFHLVVTILPEHFRGGGVIGEDWTVTRNGLKAGLALTFGAVGQYVAGVLCDRRDERVLYIVNLALTVPLLLLLGHVSDPSLLFVVACLASTVIFGVQPIENTVLARYSPARWRGRVFGTKFILAFGVGGVGSWVAGLIYEHGGGTARVFELAALLAGAALLCGIIASRIPLGDHRSEVRPPAPDVSRTAADVEH